MQLQRKIPLPPGSEANASEANVTERRIQWLEEVLDAAEIGAWDWDLANNSVQYDARCLLMLGLERMGSKKTWEERIHPEDLPACRRALEAHLDGKTPRYESVHRIRHADGHWLWILDRGRVTARSPGGKATRFSGMQVDISTQKDTEKKLLDAREEIERQVALNFHNSRMATVGEMAGGIAHEINSPLAVIAMLAGQIEDMAGGDRFGPARIREAAHRIVLTSNRIARIIATVLGISRQSPTDPMVLSSARRIVEDAFSVCQERFHLEGIHFETRITPPELALLCRPNEITQVILNLLQNARDAIQSRDKKWVHVEASEEQGWRRIRIRDSGTPIPSPVRARLFEPFFTTKGLNKGTGLGLHISRKIIQAHGGKLYLDSSSGGTCFVIDLPVPSGNEGI